MPAPSPYAGLVDTTVQLKIKLGGSDMSDLYGIQSINVTHSVNKISIAEVVLRGEVEIDSGSIPITDGDDFSPGVKIQILAGYNDVAVQSIFTGFIVKHIVELSAESFYTFKIICKHEAVKMTYNAVERYFTAKTDDSIIKEILGTYSISCSVDAATESYESMYQKMGTDWDFILSRADFNGFIVCLDGDDVSIKKPAIASSPVLLLEAGVSMISFEGELNAEGQPTGIEASAWDVTTVALIKSTAAEPSVNSQGNITPQTLSTKLSQGQLKVISPVPMTSSDLQGWANGMLLRKRLSAFKGRVKFIGNATIKTGNLVTIAGVGKKLNGNAFVSSVMHNIDTDNWSTTLIFGLDNRLIHEKESFSYAPATGQLPAMQGIHLATVKKIDADPAGISRIQVTIPSNAETEAGIWARMVSFYSTADAGSFFIPEVGDEVAVGFFDNDPRYPVILGSLYNGKNKPPYTVESTNKIKAIVTKSKMKIEFDEDKKIITLVTPGANTIIISDDGKSIELKDQNSNSVKLSSDGITLDSPKDINIKAKGNITLDAVGKVSVTAKQDTAIAGMNVTATAQVGFTAKGNATAEVSASGQTTIKGGIVMIN
jgi:Rhs element Vgr protein